MRHKQTYRRGGQSTGSDIFLAPWSSFLGLWSSLKDPAVLWLLRAMRFEPVTLQTHTQMPTPSKKKEKWKIPKTKNWWAKPFSWEIYQEESAFVSPVALYQCWQHGCVSTEVSTCQPGVLWCYKRKDLRSDLMLHAAICTLMVFGWSATWQNICEGLA